MPGKLIHADVRKAVGSTSYERGLNYFSRGHVRTVEIREQTPEWVRLRARVQGSGGRLYSQRIEVEWLKEGPEISGTCSCPVHLDCKHVAAVCLSYIAHPPPPPEENNSPDDPRLLSWLTEVAQAGREPRMKDSDERLVYLLSAPRHRDDRVVDITLRVARPRKTGQGLLKGRIATVQTLIDNLVLHPYIQSVDREILSLLRGLMPSYWDSAPRIQGNSGFMVLERLAKTGRCYWESVDNTPLSSGEPRRLVMDWEEQPDDCLQLTLGAGPATSLLLTDPPLYLDQKLGFIGRLETPGLNLAQIKRLQWAPEIGKEQAQAASMTLLSRFPELPLPTPAEVDLCEIAGATPTPLLTLAGQRAAHGHHIHVLLLDFDYAGFRLSGRPSAATSLVSAKAGPTRIVRDPEREAGHLRTLFDLGFAEVQDGTPAPGPICVFATGGGRIESASRWSAFLQHGLPELEAEGWRIETNASFLLRFEAAEWSARIEEEENGGNDWFGLRFDLELDGRRLPLLPIIAPLLEMGIETGADGALPETLSIPLDPTSKDPDQAHRYLDLPSARLMPILEALHDLFDRDTLGSDGNLRLSRFDAGTLTDLEAAGTRLVGGEDLRELARRLEGFEGIRQVQPPAGLKTDLRHYQQKGLDWLQFLVEYDLGGILADDMGLGKTIQTLAHLLLEKEAGHLDRPVLIVAPTSLMGNWHREAQRFAPDLRVLILHGPNRHAGFDKLAGQDLALTTYALLPRDQDALRQQEWHSLILDEAQNIKNPRSKAAAVVRSLRARRRLCLTGTPMENHLGELWALFDFLLPGFLGEETRFRRNWRNPIEQHGDQDRQQRLARRVAPFMLRRRKQEVLDELPPKTEIIRGVTLGEQQAALYEGIRLSMEKRVRDAIATQGLARSRITILDALLKLRQTCCDPRLLSLAAARKVTASAKLELLMDILPEQLEEGRRVLLFSQFTSMLVLIEQAFAKQGIAYSKLTGRTRNRDEAIERFRSGAADVFLISLKAGGVGLNLTEADTVILYDPWWNPAVENQAADRAHRIGQDKPVFVYKLITEGTVEEKILALQARKQVLAEGVYSEGGAVADGGFEAADLQNLFAPMGDE